MSPCCVTGPAHGQAAQHEQCFERAKPRRMSLADLSPGGSNSAEDNIFLKEIPPTPYCYTPNMATNPRSTRSMETMEQMTPQYKQCFARAKPRPMPLVDHSFASTSPAGCSPFSLQDIPPTPYYYTSYTAANLSNPFCMEPMRVTPTACVEPVPATPDHPNRSKTFLAPVDVPVTPNFDSEMIPLAESPFPLALELTEPACGRLTRCSSDASSTNVSSDSFSESFSPSSSDGVISPQSVEALRSPPGVFSAPCRAVQDHGHFSQPQSGQDWYCPVCCDIQFRNNDHCRMCGLRRGLGVLELKDLNPEMFLHGHNIGSAIAAEFRGLSPALQQMVMGGGSLHKARQPTAVLRTRICKAKAMSRTSGCESSCATLGFDRKKQHKPKAPAGSSSKRR